MAMSATGSASSSLRGATTTFASVPGMLYGTAWKKERTADLVDRALRLGFRGVDTACQPKHYNEKGVGEGVARSGVARSELFLQTKFTPISGQDQSRLPYDKDAPLDEQVRQSLETSLANLGTTYLDSWVLHSPLKTIEKTMTVWREFESAVAAGKVRMLGISNIYDLPMLRALYEESTVKPKFVQNRFYRESDYDKELRAFCRSHDITYQSFWTLTANPNILKSQTVREMASKRGATPEQIFFAFIRSQGAIFLTGTTSPEHMKQDLAVAGIELTAEEGASVAALLD